MLRRDSKLVPTGTADACGALGTVIGIIFGALGGTSSLPRLWSSDPFFRLLGSEAEASRNAEEFSKGFGGMFAIFDNTSNFGA